MSMVEAEIIQSRILVVDDEPFFGQDRVEMVLWRMKKLGLKKRD